MGSGALRPDEEHGHLRRSPAKFIGCGVLILIPVVLALTVPLYQRTDPQLGGIPFFFWWQMLMAVAAACATGTTYLILFRNDPEDDFRYDPEDD